MKNCRGQMKNRISARARCCNGRSGPRNDPRVLAVTLDKKTGRVEFPSWRRGIAALARRLHGFSGNPIEAALPGNRCRVFVVAAALVAMESVVGALVDVDLAIGAFLPDDLHVGQRNMRVQSPEMHQRRNFRFLIGHLRNEAAVVADSRRQSFEVTGRRECHRSSKTESHNGNGAGAFQFPDGSAGITKERSEIGILHKTHCSGYLARRIPGLKTRLNSIEYGGGDGGVTGGSYTVAYRTDVLVDSENLLNHNDTAFRYACRVGAIGAKLLPIRCREFNVLTHSVLLFVANEIRTERAAYIKRLGDERKMCCEL